MRVVKGDLSDYAVYTLSSLFCGLANVCIYRPYGFISSGLTGVAMLLAEPTHMPIWLLNVSLNVPVLIMAVYLHGLQFATHAIYAEAAFSLFLMVLPVIQTPKQNLWLMAIIAGVVSGTSSAMLIAFRGAYGGIDMIAYTINKYWPKITIGTVTFVFNCVIILCVSLSRGWLLASATIVAQLASAVSVDLTLKVWIRYNKLRKLKKAKK